MSQEPNVTKPRFDAVDMARGALEGVGQINNVVHIESADDLPDPTGGTHTLEAQTGYKFDGFVTSDAGLELGTQTPIFGSHGALDGFIHTGGNAAITGTDAGYFAADLYVHAPGGTVHDLSGSASTEILVESVTYSDAAMLGEIADLGTIEGFRVPSFKGCNFENFKAGLTLTGDPSKIFFQGCPFRSVTESGVTMFEYDANFSADIIDYTDNYVKDVQSDTEVIRVDPGATINDIFQYRGTTHAGSVTKDNILTGAAGVGSPDFRVRDAFPLRDSKAFINYALDSETTTTISTQASGPTDESAYEIIAGSTTERASERFTHSDNSAEYTGKRERVVNLDGVVSMGTGTDDVIAVAWFAGGNLVVGSPTRVKMDQQGGGVSKSLTAPATFNNLSTGMTFDVRIANLGSTTDITVGELNARVST